MKVRQALEIIPIPDILKTSPYEAKIIRLMPPLFSKNA
jgi:hypothetical protein